MKILFNTQSFILFLMEVSAATCPLSGVHRAIWSTPTHWQPSGWGWKGPRSKNKGGASMENCLLVVAALVLAADVTESQSQCPPCHGCGDPSINCQAGGLSSFPVFSVADQQAVESLWGTLYRYCTSYASNYTFSCTYRSLSFNQLSSLSFNDLENFTLLQDLWVLSTTF